MANSDRLLEFVDYVRDLLKDGPMVYADFHNRVIRDGYADCLGYSRSLAEQNKLKFELIAAAGELVHRVRWVGE